MLSATANDPTSHSRVSRHPRASSRQIPLNLCAPFIALSRALSSRAANEPRARTRTRDDIIVRIDRLARVDRIARTLALSSSLIRVDRLLEAFLALARFAPRTEAHRASFARAVDWKRAPGSVASVRARVHVGDDVCGLRRGETADRARRTHKNHESQYYDIGNTNKCSHRPDSRHGSRLIGRESSRPRRRPHTRARSIGARSPIERHGERHARAHAHGER